jgi:Ca2+-binding RTX toxin-like protein
VALAALWLLVVGAAAQASVVAVTRSDVPAMSGNVPKAPDTTPAHTDYVLSITARDGEANAVTLQHEPGAFVVRDAAGASAGAGCAFVDLLTVRCPTPLGPGAAFLRQLVGPIVLADRDDLFQGPVAAAGASAEGEVDAGTGDDVVVDAARAIGGAGDDRLVAATAEGGPGDDDIHATLADGGDGRDSLAPLADGVGAHLRGGDDDDDLAGGSAADVLDGGDGADRIAAGRGDDTLRPGPGADTIDGGEGEDLASFAYATQPVHVDLAPGGPADPTGEGDAMRGVESAEGGTAADVLRGDDGPSHLAGGGGPDEIDGRGGRDDLSGGDGDDAIAGGDGNDRVAGDDGADRLDGGDGADDLATDRVSDARDGRGFVSSEADGAPDTARGGAGRDVLQVGPGDRADAGSGDDLLESAGRPLALACGSGARDVVDTAILVPRDCERVRVLNFADTISGRLALRGAGVRVRVPSFLGPEEPTRVVLSLRAGGRLLGRGRRVVPDGASRVVRIAVGPRARRILRAAGSVRLEIFATDSVSTERDVVVLRAPR